MIRSILNPILRPIVNNVFTSFGTAFSPLSLFSGGEQGAWYDPSDISTLFQDTAGTVPVTADGQTVALMLDKSGNNRHVSQATASSRPVYRDSGGLKYLEFDGVDDFMSAAIWTEPSPPFEYWLAANITSGAGIGTGLFFSSNANGGSSSANTAGIFQRSDGANRNLIHVTRIGGGTLNSVTLTSAFAIGTSFVARGESRVGADEVAIGNGGTPSSASATYSGTADSIHSMVIGTSNASAQFKFYGGLRFGASLSAGDATSLRSWLNAKAGI